MSGRNQSKKKDRQAQANGLTPGISETQPSVEVQDNVDWDVAERICQLIEETPRGLDHICQSSEGLVSARTFHRWLETSVGLRQRYARAKELQADLLAFEAVAIADTPKPGIKTKTGEKGTEVTEGDMVEHRRLQVDVRKWMAGKLSPKKYGDRVEVEQSGEVKHTINFKRG